MDLGTIVLVGAVVLFVVVGMVVYTLKNLLFVATPNQVLVLAGGTHKVASKRVGLSLIHI